MAIDANSYFSNSLAGHPIGGLAEVNIQGLNATPKYALGSRVMKQDGKVFRYAHLGAATNRGLLVAQDISETGVPDTDNKIIAPASSVTTSDGTIGSRFIEVTLASVTADQFSGGTFVTTDDTGEGYTYSIKGNTATGNPASGNIRIELYEPLVVAVDATTDFSIVGSPYSNLEAWTSTDAIVAGVTTGTSTSALPFQFIQTWGLCGVLQDATVPTLGAIVTCSTATAGACTQMGGGDTDQFTEVENEPIVGFCADAGDSTGHSVIFLQIAP